MNLQRYLCLPVLLMLLWPTAVSAAADGEEAVARLSISDGLTGETVHYIMTDENGATWIATNSGVNVFNGRQLHSFSMEGSHGRPLAVNALCEVPGQYIYAATEDGLWRIRHGKDRFERVLPEVKRPLCLLALGDTVLIGSEQGVMMYDGRQLRHTDVSPSRRGLDNIVRQYDVAPDGTIWFLGRFDVNSYDARTGKITRYNLPPPVNTAILTQFASLGQRRFVVGTSGNGLYLCDLNAQTAQRIEGVGNLVSTVRRSSDGTVCVATDGAGAYLLEPLPTSPKGRGASRAEQLGPLPASPKERGALRADSSVSASDSHTPVGTPPLRGGWEGLEVREHFSTSGDALHRLPSNGTYCYYRDQNGVNWFGFVRYGLAYTYHSERLFRLFADADFTTEGLNVRCGYRHGEHLLFGTQNGFYYVNSRTHQSRYYSSADLGGGHIVNTITWYADRFYIGTFDGGLHVFDPETQALHPATFSPLLARASIGDLKVGPEGRLWIGSTSGLMIVSDGQVQQHFTEQNSRIVGGLILSITFDASGNAWLTGEDGCSLYSVRSHEIVDTNFPRGFFNRQPWMRGATGHDGLVFMRTGPQTFYTNQDMTDFGELPLPFKFRDKWCRSFIDTMNGYYILASERGLFSISYDMKEVLHFGNGEGLRGDFINDLFLDGSHQLWVATSQGLFIADMQRFSEWKKDSHYKVCLFNIRRGSDLLSQAEGYAANEQHRIRLRWNLTSDVLQAEALLLDYAKHKGRLYEYRLDGGDWQRVDDGLPIDVRRLNLGQHRLEVRLAGAPGTASVYTLVVLPSAWAYVELVLLFVAVALLWLWWRFRKTTKVLLSERDEIEDALVESETLREEHEESSLKYQKVKVDEAECADIVRRMTDYLERERVYTNQDLKMKDLADVLHLSAPKLSQVFNLYLKESYYDFINRYRLQEFKRLIAAGEYKRYTITALSEQSGFKKSNFFSTFRKGEGMTPAEYLKKQGVKV